MTRYAVDGERRVLLTTHSTGASGVGFTVAVLPDGVLSSVALRVAERLDHLARALWRPYTHPAATAGDDMASHTEGWRWQLNREKFGEVVEIVASPNLPDENDNMIVGYSPVTNRRSTGRGAINDEAFAAAVRAEAAAMADRL